MEQEVILVDEQDQQVGVMEKMEVHRKGLLHRAFSVFIFNEKGEMLLQQRSMIKYHSPGLWTNACCSHPKPGEDIQMAAQRRLHEELGFVTSIEEIFDFIYKSSFENGLTEYEFDHVFIGIYDGNIEPDQKEVSDFCFKSLDEIKSSLTSQPAKYTAWFHIAFPMVEKWILERTEMEQGENN
ncbi:MAG: isopentenyl-diphosphate Delta-isomerase [Bacteroidetes bacterium]|nr:isopentenyl-diphosphate Delta-isomerase [Bacteroidota bacterium]